MNDNEINSPDNTDSGHRWKNVGLSIEKLAEAIVTTVQRDK